MMPIERNPTRYHQLLTPMPRDEINEVLGKFFDDLMALRIKHKLPDVHVIVKCLVEQDDETVPAMSSIHLGAQQEAEGMCAWAFARSGYERQAFVDGMKADGLRQAKRIK